MMQVLLVTDVRRRKRKKLDGCRTNKSGLALKMFEHAAMVSHDY